MFEVKDDVLFITLPQGKTMEEITLEASLALANIESQLMGKSIKINGRCTTSLALFLGHKLAHICKSVSIYDPKEDKYVLSVWH